MEHKLGRSRRAARPTCGATRCGSTSTSHDPVPGTARGAARPRLPAPAGSDSALLKIRFRIAVRRVYLAMRLHQDPLPSRLGPPQPHLTPRPAAEHPRSPLVAMHRHTPPLPSSRPRALAADYLRTAPTPSRRLPRLQYRGAPPDRARPRRLGTPASAGTARRRRAAGPPGWRNEERRSGRADLRAAHIPTEKAAPTSNAQQPRPAWNAPFPVGVSRPAHVPPPPGLTAPPPSPHPHTIPPMPQWPRRPPTRRDRAGGLRRRRPGGGRRGTADRGDRGGGRPLPGRTPDGPLRDRAGARRLRPDGRRGPRHRHLAGFPDPRRRRALDFRFRRRRPTATPTTTSPASSSTARPSSGRRRSSGARPKPCASR